jgi:SET domain-containing protein
VSSKSGCNYLFDIASQIDRERLRTVGAIEYLIDATRSGNVSRYINHRYLHFIIFYGNPSLEQVDITTNIYLCLLLL